MRLCRDRVTLRHGSYVMSLVISQDLPRKAVSQDSKMSRKTRGCLARLGIVSQDSEMSRKTRRCLARLEESELSRKTRHCLARLEDSEMSRKTRCGLARPWVCRTALTLQWILPRPFGLRCLYRALSSWHMTSEMAHDLARSAWIQWHMISQDRPRQMPITSDWTV